MDITNVLNTNAANKVTGAATSSGADTSEKTKSQKDTDNFIGTRDDFLTILLAQLKHQDPLDPMKGTEFIDSITRLSSVEQAINQNQNLEKIVTLLGGGETKFGSPVSYLDKEVDFYTNTVKLSDEKASFSYNLESSTDDLSIVIKDADGNTVYAGQGPKEVGDNTFVWDGKDSNGNPQRDGYYTMEVTYVDPSETVVHVPTSTTGVVTEANFEGEDIVLGVGGIKAYLEDVISIRSTANQDNSGGA